MATVTPIPIALGLLFALAAFGGLLWLLVQESRRPVHWPEPVSYGGPRHISHVRVAMIGVLFVVWSIWSTARQVSGWR
jgi:hypothetical protein